MEEFFSSEKYGAIKAAVEQQPHAPFMVLFDSDRLDWANYTNREVSLRKKDLDLQPFYILEYMSKQNDNPIHDIGCGYNFFKKFYNIIGIDPNSDHADIKEGFDEAFIAKYKNSLDNAISINALHFCRIGELEDRMVGFFECVKPGGLAYCAINTAMVYETGTGGGSNVIQNSGLIANMNKIIRRVIDRVSGTVLYYENKSSYVPKDIYNGNVRILIER